MHVVYSAHTQAHPDTVILSLSPPPLCPCLSPRHAHAHVGTIIIYLNDVATGGQTFFPRVGANGLSVRPEKGRALIFLPADLGGVIDHRVVHESLPVGAGGQKFIATLWLRQHAPALASRHP